LLPSCLPGTRLNEQFGIKKQAGMSGGRIRAGSLTAISEKDIYFINKSVHDTHRPIQSPENVSQKSVPSLPWDD